MHSAALPLSYMRNLIAGLEPATHGFDGSVFYATGLIQNTPTHSLPGNGRSQ